ncbi:FAD/NAD(P)-binding domain-containing protein [Periconia macrospinosa]|uniref:FAD/NAD(P)-binding domain-containing protein n=1 Tax=Periconia macrospinosa TaxID=97972 RepID=A0A2V1DYK0_9PLEO|nr:FAD/NAD(P)-binding domain-containing protein [Periconia macrospinosa]
MEQPFGIKFLIVGGGIVGLATAIALRRSGHGVILLEAKAEFKEVGAGIQVPPNCTKIFRKWKILDRLGEYASSPNAIELRSYHGDVLSTTDLQDFERIFGAPYLVVHRADLLRVLLEEARLMGTEIFTDAPVQQINFDTPSVRTKNGREYVADVIIGADGEHSICRQALFGHQPQRIIPLGKIAYRFHLPSEAILANPALTHLASPGKVTSWLGPQTHVVAYSLDAKGTFNVVAGLPETNHTMPTGPHLTTPEPLQKNFHDWDPALQELLKLADVCLAWNLMVYPELESLEWIHPNGKFTLIGDAAHAMPPHLAQGAAQGVEDAVFLGELCSRMRSVQDVPQLLQVFQAKRRERVNAIKRRSLEVGRVWALANGPEQEERDKLFKDGEAGIFRNRPHPNPFSDPGFASWLYGIDVFQEANVAWGEMVIAE